jgi:HEAT repeat protein
MGTLGDARYFQDLRGHLNDVDPRVRANLVEALGATGSEDVREWVEPFLASSVLRQRINAAVALVRIGEQARGIGLLESWLRGPDPDTRAAAAYGLGATGLGFCVGVLSDTLATEQDDRVRTHIRRSLDRLAPPPNATATAGGVAP